MLLTLTCHEVKMAKPRIYFLRRLGWLRYRGWVWSRGEKKKKNRERWRLSRGQLQSHTSVIHFLHGDVETAGREKKKKKKKKEKIPPQTGKDLSHFRGDWCMRRYTWHTHRHVTWMTPRMTHTSLHLLCSICAVIPVQQSSVGWGGGGVKPGQSSIISPQKKKKNFF